MRIFILALVATALAASAADAQTAGTVFPNNQDPSNTPAQQSMQEIGGPSNKTGVVVQDPAPAANKPAPTVRTQGSKRQTTRRVRHGTGRSPPTPH